MKALDGTDVLAIFPTGAGKVAIITMFVLVLNYMKENPAEYAQHSARFPAGPIVVVVYLTKFMTLLQWQALTEQTAGQRIVLVSDFHDWIGYPTISLRDRSTWPPDLQPLPLPPTLYRPRRDHPTWSYSLGKSRAALAFIFVDMLRY